MAKIEIGLMKGRIIRIFTGLIRIFKLKIRMNPVKIGVIRPSINLTLTFII
ncbi:MAG: hypothetical protein RIS64_2249 [Bacteroidota bacterium]|jgi:hypothetical protein